MYEYIVTIPIANIYYLLCYAWDKLEPGETLADVGATDSTDLIDLFARVLVAGSRRLRHRGLDRGYLLQNGELAGVRGKIVLATTLRRNLLSLGRAECDWDELEYDTLPNQILKTTLHEILESAELNSVPRSDVFDLLRWFKSVRKLRLRSGHFRRVQLHRNNRIYSFLLQICEFIHEHWLPDESGGGRRFRDFARNGLPALFECFVFNFFRRECPEWAVTAPKIKWDLEFQNDDAEKLLPQMATDVCLRSADRSIILDTKFYTEALKSSQYGSAKLHPPNLYQLFTYLRQKSVEVGWEKADGVLLYPRTNVDFEVDFVTHGHRVRAMTLDLTKPWQSIHDSLLAVVRN